MTSASSPLIPSYDAYESHPRPPSSLSSPATGHSSPSLITRRGSYQPIVGINVQDFHPSEGEEGVPITVNVKVREGLAQTVHLRFVLGSKPLETSVSPTSEPEKWKLEATAPPAFSPPNGLDMTVQALSPENQILESVTFGQFHYWESDRSVSTIRPSKKRRHTVVESTPVIYSPMEDKSASRRHSISHQIPLSALSNSDARIRKKKMLRRSKGQSLRKAPEGARPESVNLSLASSLEDVCRNWTSEERAVGRRLVRFHKQLRGRTLQISFEPISQEEFRDVDTVISCISREDEPGACYFTSVDIIYLLEKLVEERFAVEEKNRIRRNLEGLRPITVSKHRSGVEVFFQRIMEFPEPKPRNIEKDLKVFEWLLLGQALEKILSKYSLYSYDSNTASTPSSPSISLSIPRQTPEVHESGSKTPSDESLPELTYPQTESPSPPLYVDSSFSNTSHIDDFLPLSVSIAASPNPAPSTGYSFPVNSPKIPPAYDNSGVCLNGNWLPENYMVENDQLADYYLDAFTYPTAYENTPGPFQPSAYM